MIEAAMMKKIRKRVTGAPVNPDVSILLGGFESIYCYVKLKVLE